MSRPDGAGGGARRRGDFLFAGEFSQGSVWDNNSRKICRKKKLDGNLVLGRHTSLCFSSIVQSCFAQLSVFPQCVIGYAIHSVLGRRYPSLTARLPRRFSEFRLWLPAMPFTGASICPSSCCSLSSLMIPVLSRALTRTSSDLSQISNVQSEPPH